MDKTSLKLLKKLNKVSLLTEYDINIFTGHDGHCQSGPQFSKLRGLKYISEVSVAGEPGNTPITLGYKISPDGEEFLRERRSRLLHQWVITISGIVTALSTFGVLIYSLFSNK